MINEIGNRTGIRCDACKQVPPSFFAAACPGACGFTVMACGRCASRASVEDRLAQHALTCTSAQTVAGAKADLGATVQGIVDATRGVVPAGQSPSLTRKGAEVGRQLGKHKGRRGEEFGAAAGAVVGAISDHVLGKPELAPALRAAKAIAGVIGVVRDVVGSEGGEKK